MVTEGKNLKVDFEEKEKKVQLKIDELKENKTKLEQSEYIKRNMMKDSNTKVKQINQKLSQVDASAGKLEQLTRELKRAEHDLKSTEGTVDIPKLKQEIDQLAKDKLELDAKISQLSSEMNRLHLQSSAQAQIDVLKKDKGSKEENIRRLKAKQEDTISYLLGHMPTSNIRTQIDDYVGRQTESVKTLRQEVHQSKNQLSTKEAEKKMISETLRKKEEDLKNLEEKIFSVCGSQNFDDGLVTFKDKMSQTQDTRGSLLGAEHFFKKYATDLEKDDPCCPLCHREFDTDQEVKELVIELKNKLRMVPAKLQKAEKDLDEFRKKYDSMMQLKPLKENESSKLKTEVKDLRRSERQLNEKKNELLLENSRLKDELVEAYEKIDDLEFRIVEIESQNPNPDSYHESGVLETILEEPGEVDINMDSNIENMDKDKLVQHVQGLEQTANELQQKVITLQQEKETMETKLKHHGTLEEREQMEVMEAKVQEVEEDGGAASPRHRAGSFDSNYSSRDMSNTSLDLSGEANLSFMSNTDHSNAFAENCVDFETLSRETNSTLTRIFDTQNMSSSDLSQLKLHLNMLSQEVCKMHAGNVSLKNELHNSSVRQEELEQDENKLVQIMTLYKVLQDQVNQFDVTEKQLREKLKLTENSLAELEQSESQLRERTLKAEEKEHSARRQTHEYLSKIGELKEIILDKDMVESKLSEKVQYMEHAQWAA
ncbi:DNA repair protein RAD50 [Mytilus galloprovincialis]|nr:DNA repair protein RAD50 [Mytilus galloprovincialis]